MNNAAVARATTTVAVPKSVAFKLFTERFGDWYRVDEFTVLDPKQTKTLKIEGYVGGCLIDVTDVQTYSGNVLGTISL